MYKSYKSWDVICGKIGVLAGLITLSLYVSLNLNGLAWEEWCMFEYVSLFTQSAYSVTAFQVWVVLFCLYVLWDDVFYSYAQPRRWFQRRRISVSVLSLRASALCPFWRTSPSRSAAAVVSVKPGEGNVRPAHILDLVSHLFYFCIVPNCCNIIDWLDNCMNVQVNR